MCYQVNTILFRIGRLWLWIYSSTLSISYIVVLEQTCSKQSLDGAGVFLCLCLTVPHWHFLWGDGHISQSVFSETPNQLWGRSAQELLTICFSWRQKVGISIYTTLCHPVFSQFLDRGISVFFSFSKWLLYPLELTLPWSINNLAGSCPSSLAGPIVAGLCHVLTLWVRVRFM